MGFGSEVSNTNTQMDIYIVIHTTVSVKFLLSQCLDRIFKTRKEVKVSHTQNHPWFCDA